MGTGVQGNLDTGMTQPLLNDLRMNALLQQQRGMCVPGIMQANRLHAGSPYSLLPNMGERIRAHRLTVHMPKDQVVIIQRKSQGLELLLHF